MCGTFPRDEATTWKWCIDRYGFQGSEAGEVREYLLISGICMFDKAVNTRAFGHLTTRCRRHVGFDLLDTFVQ